MVAFKVFLIFIEFLYFLHLLNVGKIGLFEVVLCFCGVCIVWGRIYSEIWVNHGK